MDFQKERVTKKLRKAVWKLNSDFDIIAPGDKIMVCLSGGKDSYTMLDILLHIQSVRKDFELIAVNLDQKQPGFPEHVLPQYLNDLNVPYRIIEKDTYSIVMDKIKAGSTMCSLCSRLRRGTLYELAGELGATKIALGHHRNDIIETFFLNLFFSGKLEAMPAKYRTDDGKHIVIRPLAYCKEDDIKEYTRLRDFPIIPCNLCGSQENLQRKKVKKMIEEWEKEYPDRSSVIFNALSNISPSHLFDPSLFDFSALKNKLENKETVI